MAKRWTSSSPACGPAPVTTVPATMATAVAIVTAHVRRARRPRDDGPAHGVVGLTGPAQQHDGRRDEHHRQQHVALHGDRVEVDEDGDPAEHDLAEHAGDEPEREQRQVAAARLAPQRTEHGGDHGHRDGAGEQPVDLLDGGVVRRHVDELLVVAVRPVVAAEPGAGQPDGGAGDDDGDQQPEGDGGDLAVASRRDPHGDEATAGHPPGRKRRAQPSPVRFASPTLRPPPQRAWMVRSSVGPGQASCRTRPQSGPAGGASRSETRERAESSERANHRYVWRMLMPPSTGTMAPFRKLAAGRHMLSVIWATSSGSP